MTTATQPRIPETTYEQKHKADRAEELALLCQLYAFQMRHPVKARRGVTYGKNQVPIVDRLIEGKLVDKLDGEVPRIKLNSIGSSHVGAYLAPYEFRTT